MDGPTANAWQVVGMLSIKDLIKELQKEKDDIITKLSDFNIGKGAFFQHGASSCDVVLCTRVCKDHSFAFPERAR